jgi:hypothetical protein
MTTTANPFWHLRHSFAAFRSENRDILIRAWSIATVLSAAFLALQPNWRSDVVAGLLLLAAAALTSLAFALTASGLAALTEAYGDSFVGNSLVHIVELARRWRMAGHLQPAWQ